MARVDKAVKDDNITFQVIIWLTNTFYDYLKNKFGMMINFLCYYYAFITLLVSLSIFWTKSPFVNGPHQHRILDFWVLVSNKKEMGRNFLRDNYVVKVYCNHVIHFTLMLCLFYADAMIIFCFSDIYE